MSTAMAITVDEERDIQLCVVSIGFSMADVIIPVREIDKMTNEEIGRHVRQLKSVAIGMMAIEVIKGNVVRGASKEWLVNIQETLSCYNDGLDVFRDMSVRSLQSAISLELSKQKKESRYKDKNGYGNVYLAHSDTGHYKIGISKSPKDRIKIFDTIMPVDVRMIHVFPADDSRRAETELHTMFEDKRQTGEWFRLKASDVDFIKSIRKFEDGKFS